MFSSPLFFFFLLFFSRSRLNPERLLVFCFLEEREGRCPAPHPHICGDVLIKCDAAFESNSAEMLGSPSQGRQRRHRKDAIPSQIYSDEKITISINV